jgi:chromosome segregation ATPase
MFWRKMMEDAIGAILGRYRFPEGPDGSTIAGVSDDYLASARPAKTLVAINTGATPRIRADGENALRMVEQAAELIKEYERRFLKIEADARSFMSRIERERAALSEKVETLQEKLEESEIINQSLEGALQRSKSELHEARTKIKTLESRFNDAVSELFESSSYFQVIQDKLGGLKSL